MGDQSRVRVAVRQGAALGIGVGDHDIDGAHGVDRGGNVDGGGVLPGDAGGEHPAEGDVGDAAVEVRAGDGDRCPTRVWAAGRGDVGHRGCWGGLLGADRVEVCWITLVAEFGRNPVGGAGHVGDPDIVDDALEKRKSGKPTSSNE